MNTNIIDKVKEKKNEHAIPANKIVKAKAKSRNSELYIYGK